MTPAPCTVVPSIVLPSTRLPEYVLPDLNSSFDSDDGSASPLTIASSMEKGMASPCGLR